MFCSISHNSNSEMKKAISSQHDIVITQYFSNAMQSIIKYYYVFQIPIHVIHDWIFMIFM